MVGFNKQLVEASLKPTESQSREKQLEEKFDETDNELSKTRQEVAKLCSEKVILNMKHEKHEAKLKVELDHLQAEMVKLRGTGQEQDLKNSQAENELTSQVKSLIEQVGEHEP